MPRIGGRRSVLALLLTVGLLVVPMACGAGSTQSPTNPSPTAAPQATGQPAADCAASSALKSSLEDLTNVKPLQDGLTALTTAIANVKSSLGVAAASASAALQPAVESVKTAFAELETATSGLSADTHLRKILSFAMDLEYLIIQKLRFAWRDSPAKNFLPPEKVRFTSCPTRAVLCLHVLPRPSHE